MNEEQLAPRHHVHQGRLDPEAFSRYSALQRVKRHLELNIGEPLSLKTAAQLAGLNETYFSTFFHRRTGVRFREWVNRVRVQRAAALVASTDTSITEIARRVGYRDLRTFERAFRRRYDTTARAYRARVRACHEQRVATRGFERSSPEQA